MMALKLKDNMKFYIRKSGLSIPLLAKETKISRQTLFNWSAGQKPSNISQVKVVADFFNISIDDLCFGDPKKSSSESKSVIDQHKDEINAGIFEVVLRRIK